MDNLAVRIKELLDGLGETGDEVMRTLKSLGIQGVRNTVRMLNPIVRFVERNLAVRSLSVDLMQRDSLCITLCDGRKEEAAIPAAVREFLDAFDRGQYSELELAVNPAKDG